MCDEDLLVFVSFNKLFIISRMEKEYEKHWQFFRTHMEKRG